MFHAYRNQPTDLKFKSIHWFSCEWKIGSKILATVQNSARQSGYKICLDFWPISYKGKLS